MQDKKRLLQKRMNRIETAYFIFGGLFFGILSAVKIDFEQYFYSTGDLFAFCITVIFMGLLSLPFVGLIYFLVDLGRAGNDYDDIWHDGYGSCEREMLQKEGLTQKKVFPIKKRQELLIGALREEREEK